MRRATVLLFLVLVIFSTHLLQPAMAWVRPCEFVQVQNVWVRQCSPFVFDEMECWTYTAWHPGLGLFVKVEACYPTDP